jgi:hypothetical protein
MKTSIVRPLTLFTDLLRFYWSPMILLSLLTAPAIMAAAPPTRELVKEDHNREIERIANHLGDEARMDDYLGYVLLPALALLGLMFCMRRFFLR